MRKPGFDYSRPGYYFVTIKTARHRNLFGRYLGENSVELNSFGNLASAIWKRNDKVYATVSNDVFRIMPNHLHALVLLEFGESTRSSGVNLSTVISSYKGCVTKELRRLTGNPQFEVWQQNYYDSIVFSERALKNVRQYIYYNPLLIELEEAS